MGVHAQSPWYFGSGEAVNLTDAIKYKSGVRQVSGPLDPTITAVPGEAGSVYLSTSGNMYLKQDSGLSTNWNLVGAGGISTINGQSGPSVSIAVGTAGTNANVTAAGNTVTVNLPTASATNRGLLSSTDWTDFNSKEDAIASGTTSQYFRGDKTWQTLDKSAVGLGNVDNTSDANKPISTATQTALDTKAPIASPTLTGDPKAPTAAFEDNDTSIATTAYVRANVYPLQAALGASIDLNTITNTGIHHQASDASASTGTNYPLPRAGKLDVYTSGVLTYQVYTTYYNSSEQYFRVKDGATWSAWKKVTVETDLANSVNFSGGVPADNTIARYDGTTGKLIQNTGVLISDTNVMSNLTGITSSGTATLSGALHLSSNTTNSQTGDNVVITAATSNVIRLTGTTLNSIAGYAGVSNGRITYLINSSSTPVTILNNSSSAATATNRIVTGTGGDVVLPSEASIQLLYNGTTQRHHIVGVTGSGGGDTVLTMPLTNNSANVNIPNAALS